MKILHTVEFYHPKIGGAQEVVRQISEHLVRLGHQVTVATTKITSRRADWCGGVRIVQFDVAGNAVLGFRGETRRYQEFLLDSDFDVMMNYAAQQWATDLTFPLLSRLTCAKVLAPCGFSGLFQPRYAGYFQEMPAILRKYDHLIFHSEQTRDTKFSLSNGVTHFSVIPNGASSSEFTEPDSGFRAAHGIPDVPILLTVGSHTRSKGHSLVIEAFRRAKIGEARLIIIGNSIGGVGCLTGCRLKSAWTLLTSGGHKRVLLLDPPRDEVLRAYQAADLFVFGSALECSPLVLFEAMAAGIPFVTLAVGNAAEIVELSGAGRLISTQYRDNGLATADPGDMARVVEELLADASTRQKMADAGKRYWQQFFTWEVIARRYEQLYEHVVQSRVSLL